MLFATSLLLLLAPTVLGVNDWSKPCTSGTCSYESGDGQKTAWGTLVINGDGNAISDITTAAGWEILNCDPKSADPQDIRIVCTNPSAGCSHVFQGEAEHTIVRLPEECGAGPFARLSKTWVHEDQSLPESIQSKTKRWWHPKHPKRAAASSDHPVRGMSIDFNFGVIPQTKGRVTFSVTGTNNPNQRTSADDHKRSLHSTVRHGSLELQKRGFFSGFIDKAKSVAKKVVAPVVAPIQRVVAPVNRIIAPIRKIVAAPIRKIAAPIKKVASKIAAPVKKVAAKIAKPIKKVASKVAAPIKKVASKVTAPVKKVASKVIDAGKKAAKKVVDAGKSAAKKVVAAEKKVEEGAKKAVGAVKEGAKKVVDKVEDGTKKAVDKVEDGAKKVVDGAKKVVDKVEDGAKKVIDKVEDGAEKVVDGAKKVVDKVEDGAKKVIDKVEDGAEKVIDGAKKVIDKVEDGIEKGIDVVKDGAEKVVDAIGDGAKKVVGAVDGALDAAGDAIGDGAKKVGEVIGDANEVDQKFEKDITIFDVNRNFPILNTSISCPQKGKIPGFEAGVNVNVDVNANARVTMGVAIQGTIVPPAIDDIALTAVLNGGAKATFNVKANAEGSFGTGSIKLFEAGIPGFDFPGIVAVGPVFSINAEASITLGVVADMAVTAAWDLPEVSLVFPPSAGGSSANASPAAAPVKLDVGASVDLTGKAEAHLIPRIDLGVNVLNGLGKATVFIDLDAFGVLDFNAKATFDASADTNGETSKSSSFGGCLGLDAGLAITAGLDGALGPLSGTKSFDLFRKQIDIFDKCFGDQKRELSLPREMTTISSSSSLERRALNLQCPGAKPGQNTRVADETARP